MNWQSVTRKWDTEIFAVFCYTRPGLHQPTGYHWSLLSYTGVKSKMTWGSPLSFPNLPSPLSYSTAYQACNPWPHWRLTLSPLSQAFQITHTHRHDTPALSPQRGKMWGRKRGIWVQKKLLQYKQLFIKGFFPFWVIFSKMSLKLFFSPCEILAPVKWVCSSQSKGYYWCIQP